jgi:hypothetical protein
MGPSKTMKYVTSYHILIQGTQPYSWNTAKGGVSDNFINKYVIDYAEYLIK